MIPLGILAMDEIYEDPDILSQLGQHFQVRHFGDFKEMDENSLAGLCREVEVILTARKSRSIPKSLIGNKGRLQYVCHSKGTIRHLLDKAHLEAGIRVTNWGIPKGVAEGALALLMTLLKQIPQLDTLAKHGTDSRIRVGYPTTIVDRKVGLYGFGPIGRHMANLLQVLGAKVAVYDPYAKDVANEIRICKSLEELFSTCEVISLHCGLNDQTRDSVNKDLLKLLPQGAILINTARGGIIVEEDLAEFTGKGKIMAGLDVFRDEKKWDKSPMAKHPNVLMTKHVVSKQEFYPPGEKPKPQLESFVLENLAAYRLGKPLKFEILPEQYDLKT